MKWRRIEGWRWVLLRQRAFLHPPPSTRARTASFACPDMLITSSVCSPVICLFVCFSFPLLVNSSQWERSQRREKLRMGHKSHQALVQLESASASPPPPPSPPARDSAQRLTALKRLDIWVYKGQVDCYLYTRTFKRRGRGI